MKCYCGSGKNFKECCEIYISGDKFPMTSEELMRSRYTAFCVKNSEYLNETTDPQRMTPDLAVSYKEWSGRAQFTKLEVLNSADEGNKGTVEFKAYYTMDGEDFIHHEISKFRKQSGQWYYRDGREIPPPAQAKN